MKFLEISLTLFLFYLSNISAHAIPKIEPSSVSITYEVQENNETKVKLINPKPEEPVLREIIYYHVIERAYGEKDKNTIPDGPDFDDTRRPFTNGHGLPFPQETEPKNIKDGETQENTKLTEEKLIEDEDTNDQTVVEEENEEPNDLIPEEPDLVVEYVDASDEEAEIIPGPDGLVYFETMDGKENPVNYYEMPINAKETEKAAEKDTTIIDDDKEENIKIVDETLEDKPSEDDADPKEPITEADKIERQTVADEEITDTNDPVVAKDHVVVEKKKARKVLFDNLKEKYEQKVKHTVNGSSRRKRTVKMPEAPTLPELKPDMFPEYIRKLISKEKPPMEAVKSINKLEKFDHNNEEEEEQDFKEEIENKIEEILNNLKPSDENKDESEEHSERTYGMRLTGDHGYVWNNLWTNPGISYDVGSLTENKDEKDDHKPGSSDPNNHTLEPAQEQKPDYNEDKNNHKDDLDIFVDIDKRKDKPNEDLPEDKDLSDDGSLVENREEPKETADEITTDNNDGYADKDSVNKDKESDEIGNVDDNKDDKDDFSQIQVPEEQDPENDDKIELNDKEQNKSDREDDNKKEIVEKPDTLDELMKNEQFWKWLAEWTSTYMELLTKHIKNIAKEEINRQMKAYIDSQKDDSLKEGKEGTSIKPEKDERVEKPVIKNNTIIVDGKEIPITNTTNFDQEELLKRRKDKDNITNILPTPSFNDTKLPVAINNSKIEENDKSLPVTINAQTIYGNTAGNEKVTNIFIFYNNNVSKNVIPDLTSKNGTAIDTFLFGQNENSTEKIITTNTTASICENKEEINKDLDKNAVIVSKDQENSKVSNGESDKTNELVDNKDINEEQKQNNKGQTEEDIKEEIAEHNKEDNKIEVNKEENQGSIVEEEPPKTEEDPDNEVNKLDNEEQIQEEMKEETADNKEETKEIENVHNTENEEDIKKPNEEGTNLEHKDEANEELKEKDKSDNGDTVVKEKEDDIKKSEKEEVENKDEMKEHKDILNKGEEATEESKDASSKEQQLYENKTDIEEIKADDNTEHR